MNTDPGTLALRSTIVAGAFWGQRRQDALPPRPRAGDAGPGDVPVVPQAPLWRCQRCRRPDIRPALHSHTNSGAAIYQQLFKQLFMSLHGDPEVPAQHAVRASEIPFQVA
ncbi:MAG TPA: hypothetical protein VI653_11720 [Steroidobacteraceae bacterium]